MRDYFEFLKEYFADTSILVGAEVGVWRGDNALSILELQPKTLILVDAWSEVVEKVDIGNGESQEGNFLSTYRKFADRTDVIIIKGASKIVANLLSPALLDFGYLDAHHGETLQDIRLWYPLVKVGGILGGHDYNMEGVYIPVNEMFNEVSFAPKKIDGITWQGIDWWVIKEIDCYHQNTTITLQTSKNL